MFAMRAPAITLIAACLACILAPVLARAADSPDLIQQLPNGLRLVARERRNAPLVAIDIWVGAGTGREAANEAGAAHFVEHLLFRGTPTRPAGEVDEAIESLGAVLNAGTGRDAAHFYTTVPAPYWQTALDVMADALRNSSLAAADVERERTVLLDEVGWDRTDARRQATAKLYAGLFAGHAYAEPTGGRAGALRGLTPEGVTAFWRRLYVPGNVTVVVVGDAGSADIAAAVTRAFADWPARPVPAPPPPPVPAVERPPSPPGPPGAPDAAPPAAPAGGSAVAGTTTWTGPAAAAVAWAAQTPATTREVAVADVLCALLNGGGPGRLSAAVVLPGYASRAWAEHTPLRGSAVVALHADPIGDPSQALERMAACAAHLAEEPASRDEIAVAQRAALAAWMRGTETHAGQARALGYHDAIGIPALPAEYPAAVAAVKPDDVRAYARKWLVAGRRVEATAEPGGGP